MKNNLIKMILDKDLIKLNLIYQSNDLKNSKNKNFTNQKIKEVYGKLDFIEMYQTRPYVFASLVTSIDGKISYEDRKEGPLISRLNKYDEVGALSDWWILNLLRTYCDAIIIGTNTLKEEQDFTGHIFDQELEDLREENNLNRVPYNIVVSLNGSDINFEHGLFLNAEIPVMIASSNSAKNSICEKINSDYYIVELKNKSDITDTLIEEVKKNKEKTLVILTGKEVPDTELFFYFLKKIKIEKVLVETPTYCHHLIETKIMDELFLNYSCVYIGGKALSIGQTGKSFTSVNHPHTKVLTIHSHSDYFFYFRHKVIYD